MASNLTLEEIGQVLRSDAPLDDAFHVFRSIGEHITFARDPNTLSAARQLVILALNRRDELNGYGPVVDSLSMAVGLYPYALPESLNTQELLEYEAHRPLNADKESFDVVFHQAQAGVYSALMDGQSVVLSAPTSFGKSLIIDALLASGRYENVAIVVPTIALIDETRRRLSSRFGKQYKVITHPTQALADRNVLVMTQERVLEVPELPALDLFVIDEFYKLDPRADPHRANLLNEAFHRLRQTGANFYMLGPNIESMPIQLNELARVVITDFSTVSLDIRRVRKEKGQANLDALVDLCQGLSEPTLIFCKSPKQVREVASALNASMGAVAGAMDAAADWVGENYHPDWSFVSALRRQIGLHHGRVPRSLGQMAIRAFNAGDLRFLVCTNTLIEGVNTSAKNVVIFDNKIANRRYDFFTFNNIKGRSGRMSRHFIGHVYLFHDPPLEELPEMDMPVLTQPTDTDRGLLLRMSDSELTDESREAIRDLLEQDVLPVEDLRKASGIDPDLLIALARRLKEESTLRSALRWRGMPDFDDLRRTCEVIWNDLDGKSQRASYVRSGAQLALRLHRLRRDGVRGLIDHEIDEEGKEPDEAVEDVLDFVRSWAGFHFPRLLMALERVVNRVVEDFEAETEASYGFYALRCESLFRPRAFVALEEYGIPMQISARLVQAGINLDVSLDEALDALRLLQVDDVPLTEFERDLVRDTIGTI